MAAGERVRGRYTDLAVQWEKRVSTDLEEQQNTAKRQKYIQKISVLTECLTSFLATGRLCYEPYALQSESLYQYYLCINTDIFVLRFANYISQKKHRKSFLPLTYHSNGIKYTWPMHNQEPKSVSMTYMTPCRTFWGSRSNNLST